MIFKGWHAAPLSSSFMLVAILGFIISAWWVLPQNLDFGITFLIFFTILFIASVISMTRASPEMLSDVDRRIKRKKTTAVKRNGRHPKKARRKARMAGPAEKRLTLRTRKSARKTRKR